jgi:hypothetical protein
LKINKGAIQMADKFETNTKFRHFAWGSLIILGVIVPLIFFATFGLPKILEIFFK